MVGYELPSLPPFDASALMPPASQAVEQRPERHAGRTGHRWALRALVVGGLAGAAWMLSGAAAHAADHQPAEPAIGGISVLSPVRTLDHPVVGAAHRLTSDVVTPVSRPVATKAKAVHRTLTAPLRPTGGPVGTTPVTRIVTSTVKALPLAPVLRPATDLLHVADPVLAERGPVAAVTALPAKVLVRPVSTLIKPVSPLVRLVSTPVVPAKVVVKPVTTSVSPITSVSPATSVSPVKELVRPAAAPALPTTATTRTAPADPVTVTGYRTTSTNGPDTTRRYADVDRHTAATTARPDSVQPAPGSPEPVPVRVHLGAVSGIPASGSGSPSEGGGCSAVVPAAVVAGTVACHRLPVATDVDVRRYDAESPTVSPD
jgi:hypothetical protein